MNIIFKFILVCLFLSFVFPTEGISQVYGKKYILDPVTNQMNVIEELLPEKKISIEGNVLNKEGMIVEGSIVSIEYPERMEYITKSDGFYSFSTVIYGTDLSPNASIIALATGYVAGITKFSTDSNNYGRQDIVLPKGGIFNGTVLEENRIPVPGVSLELNYDWERLKNPSVASFSNQCFKYPSLYNPGMEKPLLITGRDGKFASSRLVPEAYRIIVSCTGYQPIALQNIIVKDDEETNQEITLTPSLKIAGVATGPAGEPLEQVRIQLEKYNPFFKPVQTDPLLRPMANIPDIKTRQDMADLVGKAMEVKQTGLVDRTVIPPYVWMLKRQPVIMTQGDGKFEFDQLEPGYYRIFAQWIVKREDVVDVMPYEIVVSDIKPGDTNVRIQFVDGLKKRPTIRGIVIDKRYGDFVKTFSVASGGFAKGYSGSRQFQNRENDVPLPEGEFLIKNIMPKPFSLWVNSPGYCAKEVFVSNLMAGKEYDLFVALKKEGKITGKLILENYEDLKNYKLELHTPDYQPQTAANMQITRAGGKLSFDAKVAGDGTFTYDILSSGTYQLLISDREHRIPLLAMNNLQVDFNNVLDLGEIHLNTPEAAKTFSILIQSDDGTPVPEGNLFFPDFNMWMVFLNGKCELPMQIVNKERGLLVGVGVKEPDPGYMPGSFQEQLPAFYYHIEEASEVVLVHPKFTHNKNSLVIKGALYENAGLLKTGVAKLITDPSKEPLQVYSLQMNALGQIQQSIGDSSRVLMLAGKEPLGRFLPRPIRYGELILGEDIPFVQVIFGKGRNVTGLVKNKDGESVPGALLQFVLHSSAGGEIVDRILRNDVTQCIRADQYGLFIIPDLQPGTYTVWASLYGEGVSEKKEIVVEKEDLKSLEFEVW